MAEPGKDKEEKQDEQPKGDAGTPVPGAGDKAAGDGKGPAGAGRKPSPTAKRAQARREERLEMIRQQVEDGTLTIRQMTPEERKQNPPQPRKKKKR